MTDMNVGSPTGGNIPPLPKKTKAEARWNAFLVKIATPTDASRIKAICNKLLNGKMDAETLARFSTHDLQLLKDNLSAADVQKITQILEEAIHIPGLNPKKQKALSDAIDKQSPGPYSDQMLTRYDLTSQLTAQKTASTIKAPEPDVAPVAASPRPSPAKVASPKIPTPPPAPKKALAPTPKPTFEKPQTANPRPAVHQAKFEYSPKDRITLPDINPSSDKYSTHQTAAAQKLYEVSEKILWPSRFCLQCFARVVEPQPGKGKDKGWQRIPLQAGNLLLGLVTAVPAMLCGAIGGPLRAISHGSRMAISYYEGPNPSGQSLPLPTLSEENPLKIRTHNLGLVPTAMGIPNDLRYPKDRAKDIVASIVDDEERPDVIFFEEAFHDDACRILFEGLKEKYPYILHNIAPKTGFTSGSMVFSRYPLKNVEFQPFDHMLGPERMSARGITRVSISSKEGDVFLYGIHTQALIGEDRAQARKKQLEGVAQYMKDDSQKCKGQLVVGDFNTSVVSAWGHDNRDQSEYQVLETMKKHFSDPFLKDHDPRGNRKKETKPYYLEKDNEAMDATLVEPAGSWGQGPYYKGPPLAVKLAMQKDQTKHGYPEPTKIVEPGPNTWGSGEWHETQPANTARLDYILFPQGDERLDGSVEIRRARVPKGTQSAPSDHLPVDGRIWFK